MSVKISSQFIDIQTTDGTCDCYIATPENEKPKASIILYMDAFGPRDYLYEMTQKMAELGYFVLLPNVFYRSRRAPLSDLLYPLTKESWPDALSKIMPLAREFKLAQAVSDAPAFFDFIQTQSKADSTKIHLTGYCLGGRIALTLAAHLPEDVASAASFHAGGLATDAADSVHLLLEKIKAEIYVGHADQDQSMPAEQIQRFEAALKETHKKTGLRYTSELFTGAAHGYTMKDLPAGNSAALEKHWKKLTELITRNLSN